MPSVVQPLVVLSIPCLMQMATIKDPSGSDTLRGVMALLRKTHEICRWPMSNPNAVARMRLSDAFTIREVGMTICSFSGAWMISRVCWHPDQILACAYAIMLLHACILFMQCTSFHECSFVICISGMSLLICKLYMNVMHLLACILCLQYSLCMSDA